MFFRHAFIRSEINTPSMKVHISISLDDIDKLKAAEKEFGFSDEVLSASDLVGWAAQMVIATHEYKAK